MFARKIFSRIWAATAPRLLRLWIYNKTVLLHSYTNYITVYFRAKMYKIAGPGHGRSTNKMLCIFGWNLTITGNYAVEIQKKNIIVTCKVSLILYDFYRLLLIGLVPPLLRNVVYVKTTIFAQLAPKQRKLERFIRGTWLTTFKH